MAFRKACHMLDRLSERDIVLGWRDKQTAEAEIEQGLTVVDAET
jgi:hypothetical protein